MGELQDILYSLRISERIGSSGQPERAHFAQIREAGYEAIINLLPPERETLADEEALVQSLGMDYVQIPVWWDSPEIGDLEAFFEAMERFRSRRVWVHCAANKRASAFLFLFHTLIEGMEEAEAKALMNQIWEPNPVWERFLQKAKARLASP